MKGPGVSPNAELMNHVFDKELQKKVDENARLQSAVGVDFAASKVSYACNKIHVYKALTSVCI